MFLSFRTCRVRRLKLQAANKNVSPFFIGEGRCHGCQQLMDANWLNRLPGEEVLCPSYLIGAKEDASSGKSYLRLFGKQYRSSTCEGSSLTTAKALDQAGIDNGAMGRSVIDWNLLHP